MHFTNGERRWSGRQSVPKTEGSARTEVRTLSSPPRSHRTGYPSGQRARAVNAPVFGPSQVQILPCAPTIADVIQWQKASAPPRSRRFDSCHPHQICRNSSAVERRVEGACDGGSIPSSGTNPSGLRRRVRQSFWDDSSTGRATASQAADVGFEPHSFHQPSRPAGATARPAISFPSGEQGARGCLLSRVEAGSIPARGATLRARALRLEGQPQSAKTARRSSSEGGRHFCMLPSSSGQGLRSLKPAIAGSTPAGSAKHHP